MVEHDEAAPATGKAAARPRRGLEHGVATIRACLEKLDGSPGVYRMLGHGGDVLYVGKANNLKRRVAAYTRPQRLPIRLQRMIAATEAMEFITTHTEVEALLLENNLIKKLKPRYNILLRDDKTFPHILIRTDHDFPRLDKHRGARRVPGEYFGPFASASAVNRSLTMLQRAFRLRTCSDSVFANRRRPCMQYQIRRCSAPCVGLIAPAAYHETVQQAKSFLSGRSSDIQTTLGTEMQQAAAALEFERAADLRDRIRAMTQIQSNQEIEIAGLGDADVIALHNAGGESCIQVFFFRGGANNGNRAYFPLHGPEATAAAVLSAFIGQFYDAHPAPALILTSDVPQECDLLAAALSERAGRKVSLTTPQRGEKRKPVEYARANARAALERRLAEKTSQRKLLDGLVEKLGLTGPLQRVEVYDNSHIQGTAAVGAMIVAGPEGFVKSAFRKFNIRGLNEAADAAPPGGDDYAMMREVLTRRFRRALNEGDDGNWPDLVILDGGAGQMTAAEEALTELGIKGRVQLLAVAKGPEREAGRERLHLPGRPPILLPPRDPVLYFIQRLRDEAHRFAIGAHRTKRAAAATGSPLDDIAGVGAKRKKALLLYFGSGKAVSRAGLADLEKVEGVSAAVARKIYAHFHPDGG